MPVIHFGSARIDGRYAWEATVLLENKNAVIDWAAGTVGSAGVVAFLATDDASYITGQQITVDGGMS